MASPTHPPAPRILATPPEIQSAGQRDIARCLSIADTDEFCLCFAHKNPKRPPLDHAHK